MNDLTPYTRDPPRVRPGAGHTDYHRESTDDLVAAGNLRLAQRMATFFAVLIGVTSLFGLKLVMTGESGIARWLIPLVAAPVLTVVLAGGWHILLGTAARPAHSRPLLSLIIAGGIGLTGVQIATTSWFLATAIGGGAAIQHHHTLALEPFKDVLAQLLAREERDRVILGHLARAESELEGLDACERADGCVSGTKGAGKVARQLAQEIVRFRRSREELGLGLSRRPALLAHVRGQIEAAQTASRIGDENGFAVAVNSAISGLSSANAADPGALLQALGSDSDVAAVQAVYTRLRRSMDGLGTFEAPIRLPSYQPMDRATAVIHYAANVPFAWAVAVAIDVLPLALLLLILLASHRGPPAPAPAMPYDYDYDELVRDLLDEDDEENAGEATDPATTPKPVRKSTSRTRRTTKKLSR